MYPSANRLIIEEFKFYSAMSQQPYSMIRKLDKVSHQMVNLYSVYVLSDGGKRKAAKGRWPPARGAGWKRALRQEGPRQRIQAVGAPGILFPQMKCLFALQHWAVTETGATRFWIFVINKEGQTSNGSVNRFSFWKAIQRSTPSWALTEISFRQAKELENVLSLRVHAFNPYKCWQDRQRATFFFKDNQTLSNLKTFPQTQEEQVG